MDSEIRVFDHPAMTKVVASETRMRILREIREQPKSLSQLGRILGISPAAVLYHIRLLEGARLAKVVRSEVINNNLVEKFYKAIAAPYIVGLKVEQVPRGPVPPSRQPTKEMMILDLSGLSHLLGLISLWCPPEREAQLEAQLKQLTEVASREAERAYREILRQTDVRLSPIDRQKVVSSVRPAIPIALFRVVENPESRETLSSIIRLVRRRT